jgi:hypothetical protein
MADALTNARYDANKKSLLVSTGRQKQSLWVAIALGDQKGGWISIVSVVALAILTMISGCEVNSAPPPTVPVNLTVNVPTVTPQAETQNRQVKGGLEISIIPEPYKVEQQEVISYTEHPPTDFDALWFGDHPTYVYYTKTTKTIVAVVPDRLTFILHVNNQMARVFHGGGAVAEFKVGGQVIPVYEAGYAELENAILPPRSGLDIRIYGPKVSDLTTQSGIMGIFLYDLVTAQNEAGVVTEKQQFEWYFDYKMTTQNVQVPPEESKEFYCTSRAEYDATVSARR